ncbi:MazG nucleotide pyrophosphohydrolase domain-containing protein [Allofrancisella frigidaquae]|uniref:Nucleotide pyrophosphohydrolase n=1 Tax=Allofrancisella frigidaquae TaxID=1085644 RepID=A0A6M3HSY4_9GAMM|nr:MazG nucleotide pyrophosphohydrolase domain-containing protein [Allofrancisella frigidaquae]QIV94364.1 nucleotide pyrophosphohydrolase [Allofrancisella frigidaquae]
MSIKKAQESVSNLFSDITHPRLASFIALTEEIGELANEIMKKEIYEETNDFTKIKDEITDVFVSLLEVANLYNIDLETAFNEKIENLKPRVKKWNKAKNILSKKREKLD